MKIEYSHSKLIDEGDFISLLKRSTLGERRPIEDLPTIKKMLCHGNLLCTAWFGDLLVGVARSLTDFSYCCYLSDLAVDVSYQKRGIGKRLIALTQSQLGKNAKIILLAAPAATEYYSKIGFQNHPSAWVIPSGGPLKSLVP